MSAAFEILPGMIAGGDKLTVFAGPCMAENLEVCRETAAFLKHLCEKLGIEYVFKASFDKANRSGVGTARGPGLTKGLEILSQIKSEFNLPIVTDVHETAQVAEVAKVVDIIQIPAFLCRQTDLLTAAGETGLTVNIKKGQFMAPEDMKGAMDKVRATGNHKIILTERGNSFGYHNLVVDMRSFPIMRRLNAVVFFDATHSVQLPGGCGNHSGGQREFIAPLSRAALAAGIDGIFAEVHPHPEHALSDGANSLSFPEAEKLFKTWVQLYEFTRKTLGC